MASRNPLGTFLRTRRQQLSPQDVGLAPGGRRRTPGLRREELAMLAGISVDYLARLEQGRERSPSGAVLAALCDALRLDADERGYLVSLVTVVTQVEMCDPITPPSPLSATTLALLDRLHPAPAFVVEPWADVVGWNQAFAALMRPAGLFDLEPPNLARYTFLVPAARSFFRDWATVAGEQVASLRVATPRCNLGDAYQEVVGELSVHSAEFAQLWASQEVAELRRGVLRLRHPTVGDVTLDYEALAMADPGDRRLVSYLPADEASSAALDRLATGAEDREANPRRLRVLPGGAA